MVDGLFGQRPVLRITDLDPGRRPGHRKGTAIGHVLAGEHGVDAFVLERRGSVDRGDLGVRLGRAHERRPQRPRKRYVVDVARAAGYQPWVFLAPQSAAHVWLRCRCHAFTSC